MTPWISHQTADGPTRAVVFFFVFGLISSATVHARNEPRVSDVDSAGAPLAAGIEVVLKSSEILLHGEGRMISGQDHLTFLVERVEGRRVMVISRDRKIRGSLGIDQVVPLEQANDYFNQVLLDDNRNANAYWMRGRLWFYKNADDRALVNLNQAIKLKPDQARFYLTRSLVFMRRGQLDRALEDCDQAIHCEPESGRGYLARAKARLAADDLEKARADLELAFRLDPTNPSAPIAFAAQDEQQQPGVNEASKTSVKVRGKIGSDSGTAVPEPKSAAELVARGDGWSEKQEYNKAIADYDAALKLDPRHAPAYASRARAWGRKHYREREISDFTEAITLEPGNVAYRVARAESWSAQGRHWPAMTDYAEALRMAPLDPAIWVSRGNEWRKDLKLPEAIADYDQAIRLDPHHVPAYIARANAWKQTGRFDRAIEGFSELIRIDPENAVPHRMLARILATCYETKYRNGKAALDEATRACDLTHLEDPDCLDTLATAYAELGDFAAAMKWQTQAIALVRQNVPSELHQKAISFGGRRGFGLEDRLAFYKSKKPIRE